MNPVVAVPRSEETEVAQKAKRRTFTAQYKKDILEKADRALSSGELGALGALLRREGLYSSHLAEWRKARENGELAGLAPRKRGPRPKAADPRDLELAELKRELARTEARLKKAELIIDVQKKVSTLLGIQLPEPATENS